MYLPEAVTEQLPLYQRLGARLIARGAPGSVDQYETHASALAVVALAREAAAAGAARALGVRREPRLIRAESTKLDR